MGRGFTISYICEKSSLLVEKRKDYNQQSAKNKMKKASIAIAILERHVREYDPLGYNHHITCRLNTILPVTGSLSSLWVFVAKYDSIQRPKKCKS